MCGSVWPWRLLSSAISYQRSSPEAQAGSARRRSTCSAAAAVEEARVQSAHCTPHNGQCTPSSSPPRPLLRCYVAAAEACPAVTGDSTGLWGKHAATCVTVTQNFLPRKASVCVRFAERGSHCETAGGHRGGREGWPPRCNTFLNSIVLPRLEIPLKDVFQKEFLSISWYCYLPFYLKSYGDSSPGGEQGSRWWVRIAFWP